MKNIKKVAFILALLLVFCFPLISLVQAESGEPIWQIMQNGTDKSVKWVDAENPRFAVYDPGTPGDYSDDVVLDKETGLEWERSPAADSDDKDTWARACYACYGRHVGNHMGWRLPTIEELTTLVDDLNVEPGLPPGHPFIVPEGHGKAYWSSTTLMEDTGRAFFMDFYGALADEAKTYETNFWCVRGGHGHDGQ